MNRLPPVGVGSLTSASVMAGQNAFSGAVMLGTLGLVYGYLTAPKKSMRADDATHYGLLGAAVGSVAAVLLTAPAAVSAPG